MKPLIACLFASAALLAQTSPQPAAPKPGQPAQAAPPAASLLTLPPNTLVATIDGQKVLAGDIQVILRALAPAQQEASLKNPRAFLEQLGLMRRLAAMAEKTGLDKTSPLKEQLAYNRTLALAQAQLQANEEEFSVSADDVQKFYESNKDAFTSVRLKVIYIPFSLSSQEKSSGSDKKPLSESEAKAKAEKLYAQFQAGADFVKLAKENSGDPASASKDGDFGTIRRSDRIPEEVKQVVFALKTGEVSRPVRQPNGFYIFRAEEAGVEPLDKVRSQIIEQLKTSHMTEWVQATQKSVEIKIEDPAALAPPALAAPK